MFNNFEYNSSVYNESPSVFSQIFQDDIVYNGLGLSNEIYNITNISYDNGPSIQSDFFDRPFEDGGGELNYYFRNRIIIAEGFIKGKTYEELNNELDRFKKILGQNNKYLEIKVNGDIRKAKASVINMDSLFDRKNYNITFIPFYIEFRVLEPFFIGVKKNVFDFISQTGDVLEEILNKGTAKTDPVVTLIFNSASGVNEINFNIGNKTITINESISTSDVVVIDGENKTITINGTLKDYSGVFPKININENVISLGVNGTKNYNMNIYFYNKYI